MQGLAPRTLMAEYKAGLRAAGLKPPQAAAKPVGEEREYRKVPMKRLMARLNLTKYDREAPLNDAAVGVQKVKVLLDQHIGVPALPVVKAGDHVERGQMIAEPGKGLSVAIHASVSGKVVDVKEKYVMIEKQEGRVPNE